MEKDINSFLDKMDDMLDYDSKKYIVELVHVEKNKQTIAKTKRAKCRLNISILKLFNTFYVDQNILLYKLDQENIVLENLRPSVNPHLSIYQKYHHTNYRHNYGDNENSVIIPCKESQLQNMKLCVLYN
jgi:hypothetical protein